MFIEKKYCYGCSCCAMICPQKAIKMIQDGEGFFYPSVDNNLCSKCNLCMNKCPAKVIVQQKDTLLQPQIYAVKHRNMNVRDNSTSGGMFSAISDYVLKNRGVIYGAIFNDDFSVIHVRTEIEQERNKMRGSKYLQSDLNIVFALIKDDLSKSNLVLFTGTPCQCAGLRSFLGDVTNISNLIICDLICEGTPSPKIWNDYLSFIEHLYNDKILDVKFRSKEMGWKSPCMNISMTEKHHMMGIEKDYYYQLFHWSVMLRPSCHECRFAGCERYSDLTIGDFWGIDNIISTFDDDRGVSLVLINTEKGARIFSSISVDLEYVEQTLNNAVKYQHNLRLPMPVNKKREKFWQDYYGHGFNFVVKKYTDYGKIRRMKRLIKGLILKQGK